MGFFYLKKIRADNQRTYILYTKTATYLKRFPFAEKENFTFHYISYG